MSLPIDAPPLPTGGAPQAVGPTLSIPDLTVLLIKTNKLHQGLYELAITFRMGVGAIGGGPGMAPVPGAIFGVESLGLQVVDPSKAGSPNVVDASVVNPRVKRTRSTKTTD